MASPEQLLVLVILASVILYALTGGADFGGGVWDLFASGPRKTAQRRAIAAAIAPVWEANHVWLIIAVVLLFVCFPGVYAAISTALHIPITAMLIGVILRGTAFTFRAYDTGPGKHARSQGWSRTFAITSTITPVMLGVIAGAVASGGIKFDVHGKLVTDFISAWWAPFPFVIGLLTLALFAQIAAVYLCLVHKGSDLADDFRLRALVSGVAVVTLAWVAWAIADLGAPGFRQRLMASGGGLGLHLGTAAAGLTTLSALWLRKYTLTRVAVMVQTTGVLVGQAWGQAPYLLPPHITVSEAAAPSSVLIPVLWALLAGSIILVPAYSALYWVFHAATDDV